MLLSRTEDEIGKGDPDRPHLYEVNRGSKGACGNSSDRICAPLNPEQRVTLSHSGSKVKPSQGLELCFPPFLPCPVPDALFEWRVLAWGGAPPPRVIDAHSFSFSYSSNRTCDHHLVLHTNPSYHRATRFHLVSTETVLGRQSHTLKHRETQM